MNEEAKKESCCHDSGHKCCGPNKVILVVFLALSIFILGFYMGKSNGCPMQMCPLSQQK